MKARSLFAALLLVIALGACKSEIDDKPAAEVSETTASTATAAVSATNATTASVVKEKSAIEFVGAKVTRDHKGKFNDFDGTIEYADGKPSRVNFTIDLTTIETDTPKLTEHLKTPDFFDTARYPTATFTSTSLTEATAGAPDAPTHELRGTLEMHGVKKEVMIPVKAIQTAEGVRAISEFTINRHDWGVSYRGAADDLVKDEVLIKLNLLFPPPPA